jgi:hypothetical protein
MENNIEKVNLLFIHLQSFHRIVKNFPKQSNTGQVFELFEKALKSHSALKTFLLLKFRILATISIF